MALIDTTKPKWMLELSPKHIWKYTHEEICELLCRIPWALKFIEHPEESWIKFAVQYSNQAIMFVKNPSVEIQRIALEADVYSIEHISGLDEDLAIQVLMKRPELINRIPDPTPMMVSVAKIYG